MNNKTALFVTGSNDSGQIGLNNNITTINYWKRVDSVHNCNEKESEEILSNILNFAVGRSHLIISTKSNQLYCCGKNNYNQLGSTFITTDANYLLHAFHNEILKIMKSAKTLEYERLQNLLQKNLQNNTQNTLQNTLNLFLDNLFDKIHEISLLSCGWFHTLIVVNKILIFGAGHSYFGQLFNADYKKEFQYLSDKLNLLEESDFLDFYNFCNDVSLFCDSKNLDNSCDKNNCDNNSCDIKKVNNLQWLKKEITHLSCGTFSSSLVVNYCKVYSCGEIIGHCNVNHYLLASDIFITKKNILQMCHTDGGVMILTNDRKLMLCEKKGDSFKLIKENILSFSGGHMCSEYYYITQLNNKLIIENQVNSPLQFSEQSIHFNENNKNDNNNTKDLQLLNDNHFNPTNVTIFGGYYLWFFTFNNGKTLYTKGSRNGNMGIGKISSGVDAQRVFEIIGPKDYKINYNNNCNNNNTNDNNRNDTNDYNNRNDTDYKMNDESECCEGNKELKSYLLSGNNSGSGYRIVKMESGADLGVMLIMKDGITKNEVEMKLKLKQLLLCSSGSNNNNGNGLLSDVKLNCQQ
ncbi:hypothetical protein ABK040_012089 [Willaertia magna]